MKAYLLPGLGTDYRIFQKLLPLLTVYEAVFLDFREDLLGEGGMVAYAHRLAGELQADWDYENPPLIIGLSLGGFVAIELAKLLPHRRLILISTIKNRKEAPSIFAIGRRLPLYRIIPAWFSRNMVPVISRLAKVTDKPGYYLYREMLKGWSAKKLRWARGAAINWNNLELPKEYLHIQGTRDHIFPHPKIDATYHIKGGTHYMVMDRAVEIAEIINNDLNPK